jgi:hypothetical protein
MNEFGAGQHARGQANIQLVAAASRSAVDNAAIRRTALVPSPCPRLRNICHNAGRSPAPYTV